MDLIENRQSIRQYSEEKLPSEVLKQVLNAGRLAPSWMNSQPWQFILVREQSKKELLSKFALNQPHVRNADSVIVCVADTSAWSKEVFGKVLKARGMQDSAIDNIMTIPAYYPPLLGEQTTLLRTVEQITYAISYMTLEAQRLGVACCVIGAMANEVTGVNPEINFETKQALGLNDSHCIISMLTLGYPVSQDKPNKIRKAFDEVISLEKLGNPFN